MKTIENVLDEIGSGIFPDVDMDISFDEFVKIKERCLDMSTERNIDAVLKYINKWSLKIAK